MQQLGNLDCFFLAREMGEALAGGFFENFYDFGEGVFRMRFSKQSVLVDLRGFAFIADAFPSPPKQPSSFAMLLRKRLESARLESVKQLDFDRILEFSFSSKNYGRQFVVVELFGKQGNFLLLDSERRIVKPFKRASYSARSIKDGESYALPPSGKKHPLHLQQGDLQGKGKIVSFLSKQTSLSPFYLEEACVRAGVGLEKDASELSNSEGKKLLSSIASLFEAPSPRVFLKDGKPFAFSSVQMQKLDEAEFEPFDSLSQAVQAYYASAGRLEPSSGGKGDLGFQLSSQEQLLSEFEERALERQTAGKWVFENNALVAELLEAAKSKDAKKLVSLASKNKVKARVEKQFLELEF